MTEDPAPTAHLSPVSIREVWPNEAQDLTPWLAERPEFLGDVLDLELELEGQEMAVGGYSADLVFRDAERGSRVVVENMYGTTDHDHIGKLITYAAGLDAGHVVLLAENFRPEHRTALNWLNRVSTEDCAFFGLVLETWRIDDSRPAPHLRIEVQPDDWSKSVRAAESARDRERHALRRRFWADVQSRFRDDDGRGDWSGLGKPSREAWMSFKRRKGVAFNIAFCRPGGSPRIRVEAYIDTGETESTAALYSELKSRRDEIEGRFGDELEWSPLDRKRASRVSSYFPDSFAFDDEHLWPQVCDWAVPTLGRLRAAIDPLLDDL